MIEINLIPDVKQEFLRAQRMRNAAVSFSIMIGIIAAGIVGFLALLLGAQLVHENVQKNAITSEFAKLKSINGVSDLLTIQSQLQSISVLNDNRSMTSRAFDTIVAITPSAPNDVKISNVAIDPAENMMTIEGSTSSGYSATDVFRKTILNTKVTYQSDGTNETVPLTETVEMGQTSYGEDATGQRVLRFKLSFTYPEQLLSNAGKSVRVQSPTGQIDVTDSKSRVPDTLFGQKAKDLQEDN